MHHHHHPRIDPYVFETLMPDLVGHDHAPSAFLVYLFMTHRSAGHRNGFAASLREIAEGTGLSKRAIQESIRLLKRRRLLAVAKTGPTSAPSYRALHPWRS